MMKRLQVMKHDRSSAYTLVSFYKSLAAGMDRWFVILSFSEMTKFIHMHTTSHYFIQGYIVYKLVRLQGSMFKWYAYHD